MRRLFILLLLIFPAVAQASWTPQPTPASVASAYWPDSPCHGHEKIVIDSQSAIDVVENQDPPGVHTGYAFMDGRCEVHILAGNAVFTCAILIHEFGHLAGLSHDNTHPNVMNGLELFYPAVCTQFWQHDSARHPSGHVRKVLRIHRPFAKLRL